jgi:hypothetical protein
LKQQLTDMAEVLVVCAFGVGLFGGLQRGLVWAGIGWGAKPLAGLVTVFMLVALFGTWARRQNDEREERKRKLLDDLSRDYDVPRHDA